MAGAAESCTLSGVNALIIKKVSQPVDAHKRRNLSIFLRLDFSLFLPSFFFFFGHYFTVWNGRGRARQGHSFSHSASLSACRVPVEFPVPIVTRLLRLSHLCDSILFLFPAERAEHLRIRDASQVGLQAPMALLRGTPCLLQAGASGPAAQFAIACRRFVPTGIALQAQVSNQPAGQK